MEQTQVSTERNWGNCGECLMNKVEVVKLGPDGVCPKCGTDYGAAEASTDDAIDCATCYDGSVVCDTCDDCGTRHCSECDPCE